MAKEPAKELTREEKLSKICKQINGGDYGGEEKNAVTWLGSRDVVKLERFPSGDADIDVALGGGWPKGRFVEIYGPESGGKTTICYHAIAEHQKKYPDEDVALVDVEYSFDEEYAIAVGVNTKWLIVHQPDSGTQALNVLKQLIQLGVGLIVVDSVAALTTKSEIEGDLGADQVAEQARLMSKSLRQLTAEAGKRHVSIFWTNQMRELIGVSYGDKTTTPAGRALKHYASIRCAIRRVATQKEKIDGEEVAIANETKLDVKKNKTAPPFRSAKFYIVYGRGIDPVVSIFDAALKRGVIEKRGSWFSFGGENIGQGRYATIKLLQENMEFFDLVKKEVESAGPRKVPVRGVENASFKKPKAAVLDDDDSIDVDAETMDGEDEESNDIVEVESV